MQVEERLCFCLEDRKQLDKIWLKHWYLKYSLDTNKHLERKTNFDGHRIFKTTLSLQVEERLCCCLEDRKQLDKIWLKHWYLKYSLDTNKHLERKTNFDGHRIFKTTLSLQVEERLCCCLEDIKQLDNIWLKYWYLKYSLDTNKHLERKTNFDGHRIFKTTLSLQVEERLCCCLEDRKQLDKIWLKHWYLKYSLDTNKHLERKTNFDGHRIFKTTLSLQVEERLCCCLEDIKQLDNIWLKYWYLKYSLDANKHLQTQTNLDDHRYFKKPDCPCKSKNDFFASASKI